MAADARLKACALVNIASRAVTLIGPVTSVPRAGLSTVGQTYARIGIRQPTITHARTAPVLLIGMVALLCEYPMTWSQAEALFGEPFTALPIQVFNWGLRADPAFLDHTSGAIVGLLVFLLIMNAVAIFVRRRFERRC